MTRTVKVEGSDVPFEMNEALKDGESYEVKRDREVCIVIGLPSAGKSSVFVNALSKHYAARVCDSDAVKKVLPEFDEGYGGNAVHQESSDINEAIRDAAIARGDNIILPILGYKPEKLRGVLDTFNRKGYATHLFFNDLPAEKAKSRLIMRFLENGRYLPLTCVTKVGDSTINSYNEVKNEADEYAHCSNDVGRGSDPRIIESSVGAEELARRLQFRGRTADLQAGSVRTGQGPVRTTGAVGGLGRQSGGPEVQGEFVEKGGASVNAPRRSFSTVGSAYPGLNRLSDEQLIAAVYDTSGDKPCIVFLKKFQRDDGKSGFDGKYPAYAADMVSYMEGDVEQFYDVVNIEDAPSISADLTQLSARIAASGTSRIPAEGGATAGSIAKPANKGNGRRRLFSTAVSPKAHVSECNGA